MPRRHFRTPAQVRTVQRQFLRLLRTQDLTVQQATRAVGVRIQTLYLWRQRQAGFDAAWRRAVHGADLLRWRRVLAGPLDGPKQRLHSGRCVYLPEAQQRVLALLREGATAWYAARRSGLGKMTVMQWRRRDPGFDAEWRAAYKAGSLALLDVAARRHAARIRQESRT
jgi:transposase-like protein